MSQKSGNSPPRSRWRRQPIFVSSTFRDMQAERDHLHDAVFPALEEWLRKHRILLEPLDLRWGVETSGEAEAERKERLVLETCLDAIEECKPFLIVLLGDRYGWQPPTKRLAITAEEYGFGSDEVRGMSVTALEIEAGLLTSNEQATRSFVYLREPLPYDLMTADHKAIYSDAEAGEHDAARRLAALKDRLQDDQRLAGRVHDYSLEWDADEQKPAGLEAWGRMVLEQLKEELRPEVEEQANTELAQWTWRDEEAFELEAFVEQRTRVFVGREHTIDEIEEFAFGSSPDASPWGLFYTGVAGAGKSALAAHLMRRWHFDDRANQRIGNALVLLHAAGISPRSNQVEPMLWRWIEELSEAAGVQSPVDEGEDAHAVVMAFRDLLTQVAENRRIVLLIDAVDQFESYSWRDLSWLPVAVPNVRMVATGLSGEAADRLTGHEGMEVCSLPGLEIKEVREIANTLCGLQHKKLASLVLDAIENHDGSDNALWLRMTIDELLFLDSEDFKKAEEEYADSHKADERIPAYMCHLIEQDFPPHPEGMYGYRLAKLEKRFGEDQVRAFALALALGRSGWRLSDLRALVPLLGGGHWDEAIGQNIRRGFRAHLVRRGEPPRQDFFHRLANEAVLARYPASEEKRHDQHAKIADYLSSLTLHDPVALAERPAHHAQACDWDALRTLLSDYAWIKAKTQELGIDLVIEDYHWLPAEDESRNAPLGLLRDALKLSAPAVSHLPEQLAFQLSARLQGFGPFGREIAAFSTAAKSDMPDGISILQVRLHQPGGWIRDVIPTGTSEITQLWVAPDGSEAISGDRQGTLLHWDLSGSTPQATELAVCSRGFTQLWVEDGGQQAISGHVGGRLLRWELSGDQAQVATLPGHSGTTVTQLWVADNGQQAISGDFGGNLLRWDLSANHPDAATLPSLHAGPIEQLWVAADGRQAMSGDRLGKLVLWHLSGRQVEFTELPGNSEPIAHLQVSDDGRVAMSADAWGKLRLWNLTRRRPKSIRLSGHSSSICGLWLAADGRQAISSDNDDNHFLWDLSRTAPRRTMLSRPTDISVAVNQLWVAADCTQVIAAHGDEFGILARWNLSGGTPHYAELHRYPSKTTQLWVKADGTEAVTAHENGMLVRWDLTVASRTSLTSHGHSFPIVQLWVADDGRRAISGDKFGKLLRWNLSGDHPQATELPGHHGEIYQLWVTDDGRHAISGDEFGKLFYWDLSGEHPQSCELVGHSKEIQQLWVSSDGSRAISRATYGPPVYWKLSGNQPSATALQWHSNLIERIWVAVLRFVSGIRGVVRHSEWKLEACSVLWLKSDGGQAISGKAISGDRSGELFHWRLSGDRPQTYKLADHIEVVTELWVADDGRQAISGHWDGKLVHWNLSSDRPQATDLLGHSSPVEKVLVATDAPRAISHDYARNLILWDLSGDNTRGTELQHCEREGFCLWLAADGRRAISQDGRSTLLYWDLSRDDPRAIVVPGHTHSVCQFSVLTDERRAISGDLAGNLLLWDLSASQPEVRKLLGHARGISNLWMAEDGRYSISSDFSGRVIIWDVREIAYLAIFDFDHRINLLTVRGDLVFLGDENGGLHFLRVRPLA